MANVLNDWSNELASLAESHGGGVVRVDSGHAHPASGIVWGEGLILTTAHALGEHDEVELGLPDGSEARAEVAGIDAALDLALLRSDTNGLRAASIGELAGTRVGQAVLALARPGRTVRARLGIVSALGEGWRTHGGGRIERYLETDHELARGWSGGLAVAADARALGLITAGLVRGATIVLPAVTLRRAAEALLSQGTAQRGYLGVNTYPVPLDNGAAQSASQQHGLIVLSVQPDSPAARAGLAQGDVLLSLFGARLEHLHDLIDALRNDAAGKDGDVVLLRAGERRSLRITVGARDAG